MTFNTRYLSSLSAVKTPLQDTVSSPLNESKEKLTSTSPVNEPLALEIAHAVANLDAKVTQGRDGEAHPERRLLQALEQRPKRSQFSHLRESNSIKERSSPNLRL